MSTTIDAALVGILEADSAVVALAGNPMLIFPVLAPEGPKPNPFIVYARSGGSDATTMQGSSGLRSTVFDFACWAAEQPAALALANEVRLAFLRFAGYQAAVGAGHVRVNSVRFVNESDEYDDTQSLYAVIFTFEVWYNDPAP